MKQTARLTTVLGGTCLLAAVVLAGGNLVTLTPRGRRAMTRLVHALDADAEPLAHALAQTLGPFTTDSP